MEKEIKFLQENHMGYLATSDTKGHAHVRAFAIMMTDEGNIRFGTSNDKDVFAQLSSNDHIEFAATGKNGENLRVSGQIRFEKDRTIVNEFINSNPATQHMYKGRENDFELFYLDTPTFKWFAWGQ